MRDAVIGHDAFREMDRMRGFRHRERNSYGSSLDSVIVVERAQEMCDAFELFKSDIESFKAAMTGPQP